MEGYLRPKCTSELVPIFTLFCDTSLKFLETYDTTRLQTAYIGFCGIPMAHLGLLKDLSVSTPVKHICNEDMYKLTDQLHLGDGAVPQVVHLQEATIQHPRAVLKETVRLLLWQIVKTVR